jgi:diguanylate cyclase
VTRGTPPTGGARARRPRSPAERLRLLVLATALAAGLVLVAAVVATALTPPPPAVGIGYLLLIAFGTLFADATLINLRIGHHVESYTWAEANLVLGLALVDPQHLVLLSLCLAVSNLFTGRSLVKTVHNTATHVVAVALGAATTHAIATPDWDEPGRSALALFAGVVVFFVSGTLLIKAAIALSQDLPFWPVCRRNAGMLLLVMCGNALVALVALRLARESVQLMLAVPAAFALAYLGYRGHLRVMQERKVWQHLEATSREMGGLDEQEIADVAIGRAATLLEADEIEVCLYRGPHGPDEVHAGGREGRRLVTSEHRQAASRFAVTTYRASEDSGGGGEETCVVVPLIGRQDQIGVLRVRFRAQVDLSRREQQLLRSYGHALSSNLDNARLYAAVREQAAQHEQAALHDPLTGLPNRALLHRQAAERMSVPGGGFAVLLLDLDGFKRINDVHGHATGDAVLCEVAERMRGAVRSSDVVCRLGGDEFAVLLSDPDVAEATAQRLQVLLEQPTQIGGRTFLVGASIGSARFPADGTAFADVLALADSQMYDAKAARKAQAGRAAGPFAPTLPLGPTSDAPGDVVQLPRPGPGLLRLP